MSLPVAASAERPAKKGGWVAGGLVALVVAAFGVGVMVQFADESGSGGLRKAPADLAREAKLACEGLVEHKLTALSTAKFGRESATKVSDTEYSVTGSVDSENFYGDVRHATFACDVTTGGDGSWSQKKLSLLDN